MVKIITLSRGKEKNVSTIEATFSHKGELIPLKVNQEDRPAEFNEINKIISQPGLDFEEVTKDLFNLMSPEAMVQESINSSYYLSGNLSIRGGHIFFGKNKLEQALASHMLSLLNEDNAPKDEKLWRSYVKFLDNLYQNADEDVRKQLFRWIEYENGAGNAFAISDDGCLVGYKGCEGTVLEPMSVFSGQAIVDGVDFDGKIPNKVGSVVQMPRSSVQVDPSVGCSYGLHVGTRDYAVSWAPVLILVKVNPRDVVSVPYECSSQKMRVCEYTVLEVTDASSEHKMFHTSDNEDSDHEEGTMSLDEAYNLLGSNVYVEFDGDSSSGSLIDVYEDGRAYLVIDTHEGLVEVELSDVDYYECRDDDNNDSCENFLLSEEQALELLAENQYIYMIRDDEEEYEGVVVDVYISPGKKSGIILRDGNDKYSHIKLNRIEHWEEAPSGCCPNGVCDGNGDCREEVDSNESEDVPQFTGLADFLEQCVGLGKNIADEIVREFSESEKIPSENKTYEPIYKLEKGSRVVIVYKNWEQLYTVIGNVVKVSKRNNVITIVEQSSAGNAELRIDLSAIASIQVVQ